MKVFISFHYFCCCAECACVQNAVGLITISHISPSFKAQLITTHLCGRPVLSLLILGSQLQLISQQADISAQLLFSLVCSTFNKKKECKHKNPLVEKKNPSVYFSPPCEHQEQVSFPDILRSRPPGYSLMTFMRLIEEAHIKWACLCVCVPECLLPFPFASCRLFFFVTKLLIAIFMF